MATLTNEELLKQLDSFQTGEGGIGSWLQGRANPDILTRLARIEAEPLGRGQLNQLLILGGEGTVTEGFFRYYWCDSPQFHNYQPQHLPKFQMAWVGAQEISSLAQLKWGLQRIFMDALLHFGNLRMCFTRLRGMEYDELASFFKARRFDTEGLKRRGPALSLKVLPKDDRYLISEMACKSYGDDDVKSGRLRDALIEAYRAHISQGSSGVKIRHLLEGAFVGRKYANQQFEFLFAADDVLDESVSSVADLESKYNRIAQKFLNARRAAIANTRNYLSMVSDLDVYVATSMRTRQDFRNMANTCEQVFSDKRLRPLHLRYFDPTLSAAAGHEDKGLIECLMVKCAKVLVYCAGDKESYGKDAEAAMALSLGKPVIFLCDEDQRKRFYRDVHPLARLIDFSTGVAVGAMVTHAVEQVSELLFRLFDNRMEYRVESPKPGRLRLVENLTESVVRIQTEDRLLAETFWNHYNPKS
jgi:hypothetical protein